MKLLILDKDGTLVRPKLGNTFTQSPEDQELIKGVTKTIAAYTADGWTMEIASNQGGVAAGHKTLDNVIAEMRYAMGLTGIEKAIFCPNFTGDHAIYLHGEEEWRIDIEAVSAPSFRKPDAGMLQWLHSACDEVVMIGDRPEDQGAAQAAGFEFMWAHEWRGES